MAFTGGELNLLNGKYGISAPKKSVPVMKLIKVHNPKSKAELYELINSHFEKTCACGIKSKGTVTDFGKNLYESQIKEWGKYKYTLKQCIQWEYDLFVTQSLKGKNIEKTACDLLNKILSALTLKVVYSEGYTDEELRVDLIIKNNNNAICGIQVKPLTFNKMREGVILFNKKANQKWGKPVFYLFYDKNEKIVNVEEITEAILKLC